LADYEGGETAGGLSDRGNLGREGNRTTKNRGVRWEPKYLKRAKRGQPVQVVSPVREKVMEEGGREGIRNWESAEKNAWCQTNSAFY